MPARGADETAAGDESGVDAWLHEVTWRDAPLGDEGSSNPDVNGASWLLFADAGGAADALAARLRETGARAAIVKRGAAYERLSEHVFLCDGREPAQVARVWRDAAIGPVEGVVHLAGLDLVSAEAMTGAEVQQMAVQSAAGLLHVLQAVAGADQRPRAPRLWVVTRGAQTAGNGAVDPIQSAIAAVAATIVTEHPDLRCTCVDLDPGPGEGVVHDDGQRLWRELTANESRETRVAWRDGKRYVARLASIRTPPAQGVEIRPEASYLITGGAGGLGLLMARWLAERGARHLVLVGRRGATGPAADAVRAISDAGCEVLVAPGDVADDTFIDRLVAQIGTSMAPLAGVIHAAGVLDDGVLLQQDAARFATVIRPKAAGAWNLHRATRHLTLDFFVLFSSAASMLGSGGQGNYAAANGFLDALAHHRRRSGLTGISINWGAWNAVGMAAEMAPGRRRLAAHGVTGIEPQRGLEMLGRLAASGHAQVAVLPVDWSVFPARSATGDSPALFDELTPSRSADASAVDLVDRWNALRAGERPAAIQAHIRRHIGAVLGLGPEERIDARHGLLDLGMDSLMTLDLRNRLQRSIGQSLPATLVFDHPSIEALAIYLEREFVATLPAGPAAEPQPAEPAVRLSMRRRGSGSNRSRLSAPAVAFRVASPRRTISGTCSATASMRSAKCRPTAGTSMPTTTRTRTRPARW